MGFLQQLRMQPGGLLTGLQDSASRHFFMPQSTYKALTSLWQPGQVYMRLLGARGDRQRSQGALRAEKTVT